AVLSHLALSVSKTLCRFRISKFGFRIFHPVPRAAVFAFGLFCDSWDGVIGGHGWIYRALHLERQDPVVLRPL
ncbi:MAG: hypothetical protein DME76_15420, partial [Verrucomicrobia bacterium]